MVEELAFYEEFFNTASVVLPFSAEHLQRSFDEACRYGLSAFDAIHLVAATVTGCEEFLTSERITSPLFRTTALRVSSLYTL